MITCLITCWPRPPNLPAPERMYVISRRQGAYWGGARRGWKHHWAGNGLWRIRKTGWWSAVAFSDIQHFDFDNLGPDFGELTEIVELGAASESVNANGVLSQRCLLINGAQPQVAEHFVGRAAPGEWLMVTNTQGAAYLLIDYCLANDWCWWWFPIIYNEFDQ